MEIHLPRTRIPVTAENRHTQEANEVYARADLARSGLEPGQIPVYAEALTLPPGLKGVVLSDTGFRSYFLPYYDRSGKPLVDAAGCSVMWRERRSHGARYLSPKREVAGDLVLHPYFCPLRAVGAAQAGIYVVVEGEKKYAKLWAAERLYGCAIGGKDMWGDGEGGLHPLIVEDIREFGPERIIVVPDGDWQRMDVFQSYSALLFQLRRRIPGVPVVVADLSGFRTTDDKRVGIDDYLVEGRAWGEVPLIEVEQALLLPAGTLIEHYKLDFKQSTNRQGVTTRTIRQNLTNVRRLLEGHPIFSKDRLWRNVDAGFALDEFEGRSGAVLDRAHDRLQQYCHMGELGADAVRGALAQVMPLREVSLRLQAIDKLVWDGEVRGLSCAVRTDRQPESYREAALLYFMRQAYARLSRPGCQADMMVVLVGPEGVYKSSLWDVLFHGQTAVLSRDEDDKRLYTVMHSAWCIVVEEMQMYNTAQEESFKRLVTQRVDTFVPMYGREGAVRLKRRSVMVGNTNSESFMRGGPNRRLVPIYVSEIDLAWVEKWRDQLWAQARVEVERGERWWFTTEEERAMVGDKSDFVEAVPYQRLLEEMTGLLLKGEAAVRVPKDHGNPELRGRVGFALADLDRLLQGEQPPIRVLPHKLGSWLRNIGFVDKRVQVASEGVTQKFSLWFVRNADID